MLAVLTAEQLRHAAFPIGDTPKPQIRAEAARRGLAVADKPDSHDICFIPSGEHPRLPGRAHRGAPRHAWSAPTARCWPSMTGCTDSPSASAKAWASPGRGPDGRPRYVTAIDADTGTVHVGDAADLDINALTGRAPVFTAGTAPTGPVECAVQVRAHGETAGAVAELIGDELVVRLRAPLRGVARGQTLVMYRPDPDGDEVLGSATIAATRS